MNQNRNLLIKKLEISTPCKCTHRKPFLCSSGTRFTAQGSFLTKYQSPKTNQNESAIINANRHAAFLCDSNGKFLDTKRMFPPNQEVHYSWCPKIENARATLHNDINDSPQLLLIHTGTNHLSITTPIVEFIAELSTLITEAATKFPTSKII